MIFKKEKESDYLTKDTLKEIKKLKKSPFNNKSIVKLNKILRIYLQEKYKLKKGLTVEELVKKIKLKKISKKIKLDVGELVLELYEEEYKSKEKLTRRKFNNLIKELINIVKNN